MMFNRHKGYDPLLSEEDPEIGALSGIEDDVPENRGPLQNTTPSREHLKSLEIQQSLPTEPEGTGSRDDGLEEDLGEKEGLRASNSLHCCYCCCDIRLAVIGTNLINIIFLLLLPFGPYEVEHNFNDKELEDRVYSIENKKPIYSFEDSDWPWEIILFAVIWCLAIGFSEIAIYAAIEFKTAPLKFVTFFNCLLGMAVFLMPNTCRALLYIATGYGGSSREDFMLAMIAYYCTFVYTQGTMVTQIEKEILAIDKYERIPTCYCQNLISWCAHYSNSALMDIERRIRENYPNIAAYSYDCNLDIVFRFGTDVYGLFWIVVNLFWIVVKQLEEFW